MIHELHECMSAWLPWLHAWNAIEAGSDTKCERGMPWRRGCSRECIVMNKPDVLLDDEVVETLAATKRGQGAGGAWIRKAWTGSDRGEVCTTYCAERARSSQGQLKWRLLRCRASQSSWSYVRQVERLISEFVGEARAQSRMAWGRM